MLTSAIAIFALALSAIATPLQERSYLTTFTSPQEGNIWFTNRKYTVTWDTSNLSPELKDANCELLLGHAEHDLDTKHPLAEGFRLSQGHVEVTAVADAGARRDYFLHLVVGNKGYVTSPQFGITIVR